MTSYRAGRVAACAFVVVGLTAAGVTAGELPIVKGKKVVASVQGELITLSEFDQQLAAMKREQAPGATVDRAQELALLGRMISMVLVAQEARRMGLDQLPEVRQLVDSNARVALREELVERLVKDVKADPKEVEKIYQASVREWKVSAVLFEKEEHARSMEAELGAGGASASSPRSISSREGPRRWRTASCSRAEPRTPRSRRWSRPWRWVRPARSSRRDRDS